MKRVLCSTAILLFLLLICFSSTSLAKKGSTKASEPSYDPKVAHEQIVKDLVHQVGDQNDRVRDSILMTQIMVSVLAGVMTIVTVLIGVFQFMNNKKDGQVRESEKTARESEKTAREIERDSYKLQMGNLQKESELLLATLENKLRDEIQLSIKKQVNKKIRVFDEELSLLASARIDNYEKLLVFAEAAKTAIWDFHSVEMMTTDDKNNLQKLVYIQMKIQNQSLAVMQMISPDPTFVFTGIGTLHEAYKEIKDPPHAFLDLLALLNKQKRLADIRVMGSALELLSLYNYSTFSEVEDVSK
ncbi:MAG: hypothetical protein HQK96_14450 [Nitrospirae bacterium]|nr:hypothetical protein [Nitrospirota bacterium]